MDRLLVVDCRCAVQLPLHSDVDVWSAIFNCLTAISDNKQNFARNLRPHRRAGGGRRPTVQSSKTVRYEVQVSQEVTMNVRCK